MHGTPTVAICSDAESGRVFLVARVGREFCCIELSDLRKFISDWSEIPKSAVSAVFRSVDELFPKQYPAHLHPEDAGFRFGALNSCSHCSNMNR